MSGPMTTEGLENFWEMLAEGIDRAGEAKAELFLAKLALLLGREVGDAARCRAAIETALEDLT